MENEFLRMDKCTMTGKFIISSKSIKYSKLEWAWRIGITVAMITLICMGL